MERRGRRGCWVAPAPDVGARDLGGVVDRHGAPRAVGRSGVLRDAARAGRVDGGAAVVRTDAVDDDRGGCHQRQRQRQRHTATHHLCYVAEMVGPVPAWPAFTHDLDLLHILPLYFRKQRAAELRTFDTWLPTSAWGGGWRRS